MLIYFNKWSGIILVNEVIWKGKIENLSVQKSCISFLFYSVIFNPRMLINHSEGLNRAEWFRRLTSAGLHWLCLKSQGLDVPVSDFSYCLLSLFRSRPTPQRGLCLALCEPLQQWFVKAQRSPRETEGRCEGLLEQVRGVLMSCRGFLAVKHHLHPTQLSHWTFSSYFSLKSL